MDPIRVNLKLYTASWLLEFRHKTQVSGLHGYPTGSKGSALLILSLYPTTLQGVWGDHWSLCMRLGLSGDFCANGIVSHRRTGFPHLGGGAKQSGAYNCTTNSL